jgi:hypothetical protein
MDYPKFPPSRLELIRKWQELATADPAIQQNVFFKFVATWVAFNAFYAEMFPYLAGKDGAQIRSYSQYEGSKRLHSELLKEDGYHWAVKFFCQQGVLREKQPTSLYDFEGILTHVYRVRCNLFHGDKTPQHTRDYNLVENAYAIVSRLVQKELENLVRYETGDY